VTNPDKHRFVDRVKTIEERLIIIVNPMSKKGSLLASRVRSLIRREGMNLEETSTDHPDDVGSTMEFWSKRFGGSRVIMVFGGDGAINQVINNVMLSRSNKNVVLVPIPAGTANDFCRALGFESVESTLEAMVDFNIRPIDLIKIEVNGIGKQQVKYCSNILGIGLDGDLANRAQKYKRFGVIGYWYTSLKRAVVMLFRGTPTWKLRIKADGFEHDGDLLAAMFANINQYGQNLLIAPGAKPDDRRLYGTIARPMKIPAAFMSGLLLLKGKHTRMPAVESFDCDSADIEVLEDVYAQEDGEVYFYPAGTSFHVSIERGALNVLTASPSEANGS